MANSNLQDRISAVQHVNDPTIMADDIQRWSNVALWALMAFTTALAGMFYFEYFKMAFGPWAAAGMAATISFAIEFGKRWAALKSLRTPFFLGWRHIWHSPEATVMWGALTIFACVTFLASVVNSTRGAEHLSRLLYEQKNSRAFEPNAAAIDQQIAALQKSMEENRAIKWKGTVTYHAQKAIDRESAAMLKLQAQREKLLDGQRRDFEKGQEADSRNSALSAKAVLAVGGFIEAFQFLLLLAMVAAERSMDRTASERRAADSTTGHSAANIRRQWASNGQNQGSDPHKIGFFWDGYGGKPAKAVTQRQVAVSQQLTGSDEIMEVCKTAVERDLPNFGRRDARPSTVSARVNAALEQCHTAIEHPSFRPTADKAAAFYAFLTVKAFPLLNSKGWPYERDKEMARLVLASIPQQQPRGD